MDLPGAMLPWLQHLLMAQSWLTFNRGKLAGNVLKQSYLAWGLKREIAMQHTESKHENAFHRILFLSLLLILMFSGSAYAELQTNDPNLIHTAPVMVDGEELFYVAGTVSFPAEKRAEQIDNRILNVAANRDISLDQIRFQQADGRVDIFSGSQLVMGVYPADAIAEGVTPLELAEIVVNRISLAVTQYREERTPAYLLLASLKALAALGLTSLCVLATFFVFQKWHGYLEQRFKDRLQDFKIESFEILRAENIWVLGTRVSDFLSWFIILAFTYAGVEYCLMQFPWTRGVSNVLLDWLIDPLEQVFLAIVNYLPSLVFLLILIFITRYCLKLIHLFFRGIEKQKVVLEGFEPEWAQPTYKLLRLVVLIIAVVLAYPYIPGSGSAAFQGLSILLGIMVSLGASSAVSSIVAGYAMTYRRAFKIGDMIQVGEYTGVVEDMRLLVTHLRTFHNEEVVLPNSQLLNSSVINLSRPAQEDGLLIHTRVGIGYETPWRQVEAMLKEAANRTRSLKATPAPFVLVQNLGDYAIDYQLNAYVSGPTHLPHRYAELHRNVLDVFNEYGVAIMTPSYRADPTEPKLVPPEDWYPAPAKAPEGSAAVNPSKPRRP